MTKTEQKVYDYAQSVDWGYEKVWYYILNHLTNNEYGELNGADSFLKAKYFIEEHETKEGEEYSPLTITIPIDDYNRLRKLEIKQQIKKLKKELKGL